MSTEELESLLEGGSETQSLDYKESCPWDTNKFAKDILAMSNIPDGGVIIIGVKELDDSSYERRGVTAEHKSTYKRDEMKDQIAKYADPHVDFIVDFVKDKNGLEYVAIRILPFREIPVICRTDGIEVKAGGVYYRNRNRRVESALISSSYDMREIIERAAVKLMQRNVSLGLVTKPSVKSKLEQELGDL